ncbi:hypothetical protein MCUN1_003927 [Malassezia cuniculi]|uniref:Uncharacterized protein n=1 Tax=Malassezia cuniculi TaxID=948313 RepID=A0AAF0J8E7_9BASI|nr:hypothetical protein MCUN1_003927 [Malassezia cuniculi]
MTSKGLPELPNVPIQSECYECSDDMNVRQQHVSVPSALGFSTDSASENVQHTARRRPVSYAGYDPSQLYVERDSNSRLFPPIPIELQYSAPLVPINRMQSVETNVAQQSGYPANLPQFVSPYGMYTGGRAPMSMPDISTPLPPVPSIPVSNVFGSFDVSGYELSASDILQVREALAAGDALAAIEASTATEAKSNVPGMLANVVPTNEPSNVQLAHPQAHHQPQHQPHHQPQHQAQHQAQHQVQHQMHVHPHTQAHVQPHVQPHAQAPVSIGSKEPISVSVPQAVPPITPACAAGLPRPCIIIEYCDRCRWQHRASWIQTELLLTFSVKDSSDGKSSKASGGAAITSTMLLPRAAPDTAGRFRVWLVMDEPEAQSLVDLHLLWDRKAQGGFPDLAELKRLVRDKIAPGLSLGHSDIKH